MVAANRRRWRHTPSVSAVRFVDSQSDSFRDMPFDSCTVEKNGARTRSRKIVRRRLMRREDRHIPVGRAAPRKVKDVSSSTWISGAPTGITCFALDSSLSVCWGVRYERMSTYITKTESPTMIGQKIWKYSQHQRIRSIMRGRDDVIP